MKYIERIKALVLQELQAGDKLHLQREVNKFDDQAIVILNSGNVKLGYVPEDCPVTEELGHRLLRLPLSAMLTTADAAEVVERINQLLSKMPV